MFGLSVATTILSPLFDSTELILPSSSSTDDQLPEPTNSEPALALSSSMLVIVAALACEYAGRIAVPPKALLEGIGARMGAHTGTFSFLVTLSWAECMNAQM